MRSGIGHLTFALTLMASASFAAEPAARVSALASGQILLDGKPTTLRGMILGCRHNAVLRAWGLCHTVRSHLEGFAMWMLPIAIPILLFLMPAHAATTDQVITINTRPGVKQAVLVLEPTGLIKGVVLMFPGHEGVVRFTKTDDGYEVENEGGGFTAHKTTRETFREHGLVAAVMAPPTGREGGLDTYFRSSKDHTEDVVQVIAYLRQKYGKAPILHGHCRGTFSPASIATQLKNDGIGGLILTSPRSQGRWGAVTDYQADVVNVPVLLVQHTQDSCPGTLYEKLGRVVEFYKRSSKQVDVILVSGGNGKDGGQNCQNGFHSFSGLQKETATAIAGWVLGSDFPRAVHD